MVVVQQPIDQTQAYDKLERAGNIMMERFGSGHLSRMQWMVVTQLSARTDSTDSQPLEACAQMPVVRWEANGLSGIIKDRRWPDRICIWSLSVERRQLTNIKTNDTRIHQKPIMRFTGALLALLIAQVGF